MSTPRTELSTAPASPDQSGANKSARDDLIVVGAGVVVGLLMGALTAYAQGWLGDSTASLANSAGPWSLAAFVVARFARRLPAAVATAVLTLVCCELGYVIATEIKGGSNATSTVMFWLTAAVLAGPPLGVAAAWSSREGLWRAVGFAVVGGVLVGEGTYGWTSIADTTDWRYWAVELALGVVVIALAAVRATRPLDAMAAITVGAAAAAVVLLTARAF